MLKQIKTLGLVLVIGSMLVGCESEVEDVEIEDTNPTKQEQQIEEKEVKEEVEKQESKEEKKEEKEQTKKEGKIDKETYLNNLEKGHTEFAAALIEKLEVDELNEQEIFDIVKGSEEVNEYTFNDDIDACRLAIMKGLIKGGNASIKPEDMLEMYNYMIENNIDNVNDYYKIMNNNNEEETKEQPKEENKEVKNEDIYDVKVLDMVKDARIRYENLSDKDIKIIEKHMPEFIELGKEHAEIYNKEKGEEYKYFKYDDVFALAKSYKNEFEDDETFTYLFAAYRLAYTETIDIVETIEYSCDGTVCKQVYITDKYVNILNNYPESSCGHNYEGEYIKDHSITAEEVFEVLDTNLKHGYEVLEQTETEIVVETQGSFPETWKIDLNTRHIN